MPTSAHVLGSTGSQPLSLHTKSNNYHANGIHINFIQLIIIASSTKFSGFEWESSYSGTIFSSILTSRAGNI